MREKVLKIWPEINWIQNKELREKTLDCWVYAIENSGQIFRTLSRIIIPLLDYFSF